MVLWECMRSKVHSLHGMRAKDNQPLVLFLVTL